MRSSETSQAPEGADSDADSIGTALRKASEKSRSEADLIRTKAENDLKDTVFTTKWVSALKVMDFKNKLVLREGKSLDVVSKFTPLFSPFSVSLPNFY